MKVGRCVSVPTVGPVSRSCSLVTHASTAAEQSACIRSPPAALSSQAWVHYAAILRAPFCSLNHHFLTVVISCGENLLLLWERQCGYELLVCAWVYQEETELPRLRWKPSAVLCRQCLLETVRGFADLTARRAVESQWHSNHSFPLAGPSRWGKFGNFGDVGSLSVLTISCQFCKLIRIFGRRKTARSDLVGGLSDCIWNVLSGFFSRN